MIKHMANITLTSRKGKSMQAAKKVIMLTVFALLVWAGSGFCADVAKIGVVDFQRLFDNSDAGKEVKDQITSQGKQMEAELKDKSNEIEEIKKRLDRESLVMSKEMREDKEREFRIKINDFKSLQNKYEMELQDTQKRLMGGLQRETLAIIGDIGKSEGYLLIMDKRGVLYSPSTIDITDQVIKKYDSSYVKKKTKP